MCVASERYNAEIFCNSSYEENATTPAEQPSSIGLQIHFVEGILFCICCRISLSLSARRILVLRAVRTQGIIVVSIHCLVSILFAHNALAVLSGPLKRTPSLSNLA